MNSKRLCGIAILIGIISLFAVFPAGYSLQQGKIYMEIVNPKDSYNIGENFTVQIRVTNIENCWGVVFSIWWNTTLLNVTGMPTQGDFLEGTGISTSFMVGGIDYINGYVSNVAYVRLGDVPGVSITEPDSGLVATIEFVVLEAPVNYPLTTQISFVDTEDNPTGWSTPLYAEEYDFADMTPLNVELIPEISCASLLVLLLICSVTLILGKNFAFRRK